MATSDVPESVLERLAERYPRIDNPQQLEDLLRDIGRRSPSLKVEAHFEKGVWIIEAASAPLVAGIELELVSRFLKTPLYASVQNYIGQVDSPEIREKILATIQAYLRKRGFPQNQATMTATPDDNGIIYTYKIKEGEPCLVDKVDIGFTLPAGVKPGIAVGDLCDREEIETIIGGVEDQLRNEGYNQLKLELADLAYHPENNSASVYISGVLGQRIRYEINDASKKFLIDDLFADDELTNVDPTIVGPDAMAVELARRYRNRGFTDVEITGPDVTKKGDDQFIYRYNVTPGTQYLLKSVTFEGAKVFTDEELLETMGLKTIWQTARPLNLEEIQEGLNSIRGRYQQEGYWDAKVRDPGSGQRDKESGQARLIIQIEEGQQRVLKGITLKGNSFIASNELEPMLKTDVGAALDRSKLVDFQQNIRTAFISKGFIYADVHIDLEAETSRKAIPTEVIVKINEGARVKIGDITITGLVNTHPKVVKRELLFDSGDWYEPEKITDSRRALTRLGLFRSVQITPADRNAIADKAPEVDLQIDVREGKSGNVSFGPGWSLERGWNYGTEASYNNIGGVGRQVSVRAAISEEKQQKAIGPRTLLGRKIGTGYLEPYIFSWPVDATIALNQKAEAISELWDLSYGGEIALQHKLRVFLPGSIASVFYGQKVSRTEGASQKEEDLVASNVRTGRTGFRYNIDRRDNLKFPLSGFTLDTETAWARYQLGGDMRYFYWEFTNNHYFRITDNWVFAISLSAASYDDIERKGDRIGILPPTERLYAGGAETVRGYATRSLGPTVRGPTFKTVDSESEWDCGYDFSALGGNRRTTVKTEMRHRIDEVIAVTGFVDSGSAFLSKDQLRKFNANFDSPVDPGPINTESVCGSPAPRRSVQGNIGYEYEELLKNPEYLATRHYLSYGGSLNLLTALGAVNFAYGLPWREPKTTECQQDEALCDSKMKHTGHWLLRGEFHLNIGARF